MASPAIQQSFELALQHHKAGRLQDAQSLYQQILNQQQDHAEAIYGLGIIAHQLGRNDAAVDLIRRAIALKPHDAEAINNLGVILKDSGEIDQAIAAYRQALSVSPGFARAWFNLGNALAEKGLADEAIIAYRQAIVVKPTYIEAYTNLGIALGKSGQLGEAISAFRHAIALQPNYTEGYTNLGNALTARGQLGDAIAAFRRAIALNGNAPEAHRNLGDALGESGRLDEAIAAYRQAIALKPDDAQAFLNLGNALGRNGSPDEAIGAYARAIAIKPDFAKAYSNLGNALRDKAQLDEAIGAYRRAIVLKPDYASAHSNLLYTLHYHPDYDARRIAAEHRDWNRQHAEPLANSLPHANDRNPHRQLRIGYVSPDFRQHPIGMLLMPLLEKLDREQFEIFCYSDVRRADAMTQRIRSRADVWRNTAGMTDEALATSIRQDRIDILVDLTMHMAANRLLVFARKPAPVQVTWLAYPASTGLTAIDYRLTDPYLDPVGIDESIYSERTIRLPETYWCYDVADGRDIAVNALPAMKNGFVTFGCLNNFCKINDALLALWAQVLRQVENARLLLLAKPGSHRERTTARLAELGVDPGRVEFIAFQPRREYLELYCRIDIGLDTFPYNGHTTSFDSFWMGVPVVTRVGTTSVSRAGWCQLSNLGLPELAGHSDEEFVRVAVKLATDLPQVQELRASLRGRLERSPLMDAPRFARNIETAYRRMWQDWCAMT